VSIVEASPDTVTSLDLERWKAISLGDWSINASTVTSRQRPVNCGLRPR
jgi:hypothetical protein